MLRLAAIVAVFSFIGSATFAVVPAQAQQKAKGGASCSLAACEQACNQKGGRMCNLYCSNELSRRGCH